VSSSGVTVIVLNWNGRPHLSACLASVSALQYPNKELLLVDNASTDGSREDAVRAFPQFRILANATNLGYAGGNNAGIRASVDPLILLVNSDTTLAPDALDFMVRAMEADARLASISPKVLRFTPAGTMESAGLLLLPGGHSARRGVDHPDDGSFDTPIEVFGAHGACCLLRRAALERVGLLDEDYFAYNEEFDLAWRLRLAGFTSHYEPRARVQHHISASLASDPDRLLFLLERNRIWTLVKNAGVGFLISSLPALIGGELAMLRRCLGTVTLVPLKARLAALRQLIPIVRRRMEVQRLRVVPDSDILRWVTPPPPPFLPPPPPPATGMDLGLIYTRYRGSLGGAETQLALLARGLTPRHRVRVLAPLEGQAPADPYHLGVFAPVSGPRIEAGVIVLALNPTLKERFLGLPSLCYYLPRLRRWFYQPLLRVGIRFYCAAFARRISIQMGGVQVIYCVALNHLGWAAYHAARFLGVPFVLKPLVHPGQYGDDDVNFALARRADAVIALNASERDYYQAQGVPAERIEVIGIAPILDPSSDPARLRAELGITGTLVTFLGRRSTYKGVPELIRAVESLWPTRPDLTLALAGPVEEPLPLPPRVLDLGAVSEETKASLLAASDMVCLPSRHEIQPGVVLEAWALGKPVIVGDSHYLKQLVRDGVDGLVVPITPSAIAGAIEQLASDSALARRLGAAGQERIQRDHEPRAIIARHEELFQRLIDKPAGENYATRSPSRASTEQAFHDALFRDIAARTAGAALPELDRFMAQAVRALGPVQGRRILDCGCGDGSLTVYLALHGAEVISLDLSGEALHLTARRAAQAGVSARVRVLHGSLEDLPLRAHSVDAIVGSLILHHVDAEATGREIARALAPGGIAVFSENFAYNPLLIWARTHLVGRFGIPRLGTITEQPLGTRDVALLSRELAVEHAWPELLFFQLLDRQVFRYRFGAVSTLCQYLDGFLYRRFPALARYSYRGTLLLRSRALSPAGSRLMELQESTGRSP
jgi:GT2 family glycosyltransferase/glycosyltransferase involved in cell wall biosynthesis/SAM-dependent methyltransferase